MKRSTLVMVLCLVLAVAMGVGSTMAYLQDTDEDVNVMTLGSVYITQNEQERDADGNLVPFTQEKPAYPAVGPIEWAEAGKGVVVNGTEYKVFSDKLQNVVDKIVTVTNTGKSDAYIRTIIAFEAPDAEVSNLLHVNYNGTDTTMSGPVYIERNGVNYECYCYTYSEALAPQETSAPSLVQLFLDSKATNADVEKFGDTWEVLVLSQAVQTQGFADAETALNTAFGDVTAANAAKWFGGDFGKDNVGTPGDKWPSNNPPSFVPEGAKTIANADELNAALTEGGEYYLIENLTLADNSIVVKNGASTTINMNGKTISTSSTSSTTSNGIEVQAGATLELKGEGLVTFYATKPDTEWGGEGQPAFPGYANNTIKNLGKLIIDGPTVENKTAAGGASYCIDCYQGSELIIESGEIKGYDKCAIRMFANSNTLATSVTVNGGEISGKRGIWIQLPGSKPTNVRPVYLTVTGGTITSLQPDVDNAIYSYSYGDSFANTNITITGGTFNGTVAFGGGYKGDTENVNITGGTFNGYLGRYLANDGWEDIAKP